MDIQVFLNTSREGFFGFRNRHAPPALQLAARFHLDPTAIPPLLRDGVPVGVLELVFEQLNVGGDIVPAEPWTSVYREAGNRSLSVGDVVCVGERAFAVAATGWEPVSTTELRAALTVDSAAKASDTHVAAE